MRFIRSIDSAPGATTTKPVEISAGCWLAYGGHRKFPLDDSVFSTEIAGQPPGLRFSTNMSNALQIPPCTLNGADDVSIKPTEPLSCSHSPHRQQILRTLALHVSTQQILNHPGWHDTCQPLIKALVAE